MTANVPLIYARARPADLVSPVGRGIALLVALGCLATLLIAAWLRPDPSGVSTHTQLGMMPCQMEQRLGLPCMTCGMTTSFSLFVRGRILGSLYIQPMGMLLALGMAMTFWASGYIALTGRPVHRLLRIFRFSRWFWLVLSLTILAWAWKIWIHLRHADGWAW